MWSRERIRRIFPNLWTVHVLHKYTSMQARVKHRDMNTCKQMKTTTTTHGGIHPDIWSLIFTALEGDTSAPIGWLWICIVSIVESDASCFVFLASTVSVCQLLCLGKMTSHSVNQHSRNEPRTMSSSLWNICLGDANCQQCKWGVSNHNLTCCVNY